MPECATKRRTQFSSCDECRKSRVACDASRRRATHDEPSTSCSRCLNRNWSCTFKWIEHAKSTNFNARAERQRRRRPGAPTLPPPRNSTSPSQYTEAVGSSSLEFHRDWFPPSDVAWTASQNPSHQESLGTAVSVLPVEQAADTGLSLVSLTSPSPTEGCSSSYPDALWLQNIYIEGFEAIFGSWMGRHSCPLAFGHSSPIEEYIGMVDLCCQLDRWMAESLNDSRPPSDPNESEAQTSEKDRRIDQSLWRAIAAFSARWLHITLPKTTPDSVSGHSTLVASLWKEARRDMLRVMNRPSYRSMLALFLFALTPIPASISEEEDADGISGQACVHAALHQIQTLRARQRNLQFNGSKVSPFPRAAEAVCTSNSEPISTSSFINAESVAYWAALTFDTSASLTLNCRPILSSGLFGFEAEMPWRLVKTCAKMFDHAAGDWGQASHEMTDERANQIVAASAAWKLLAWKLTAVFKEALRDGHDESEVSQAFAAVVDATEQFDSIYRHLLEACQKRMLFLNQKTRFRWYSVMLHYHLSILMLVDIVETANRTDLLAKLAKIRTDAENAVMNTLEFGLRNTYTLTVKPDPVLNDLAGTTPNITTKEASEESVTIPLISIDPYPHHVVASVQLVRKAIDRDLSMRRITEESYRNLQATLESTLHHLPQSSKSVRAALARNGATG